MKKTLPISCLLLFCFLQNLVAQPLEFKFGLGSTAFPMMNNTIANYKSPRPGFEFRSEGSLMFNFEVSYYLKKRFWINASAATSLFDLESSPANTTEFYPIGLFLPACDFSRFSLTTSYDVLSNQHFRLSSKLGLATFIYSVPPIKAIGLYGFLASNIPEPDPNFYPAIDIVNSGANLGVQGGLEATWYPVPFFAAFIEGNIEHYPLHRAYFQERFQQNDLSVVEGRSSNFRFDNISFNVGIRFSFGNKKRIEEIKNSPLSEF